MQLCTLAVHRQSGQAENSREPYFHVCVCVFVREIARETEIGTGNRDRDREWTEKYRERELRACPFGMNLAARHSSFELRAEHRHQAFRELGFV